MSRPGPHAQFVHEAVAALYQAWRRSHRKATPAQRRLFGCAQRPSLSDLRVQCAALASLAAEGDSIARLAERARDAGLALSQVAVQRRVAMMRRELQELGLRVSDGRSRVASAGNTARRWAARCSRHTDDEALVQAIETFWVRRAE